MRIICPLVAKGRHTTDSCAPNHSKAWVWKVGKRGKGFARAMEGALGSFLAMFLSKQTLPPPCF